MLGTSKDVVSRRCGLSSISLELFGDFIVVVNGSSGRVRIFRFFGLFIISSESLADFCIVFYRRCGRERSFQSFLDFFVVF